MNSIEEPTAPPPNAPTVCVIDTGITPGNPFLSKVVLHDTPISLIKGREDSPHDEHGHGSGVASLVSYHSLALDTGAQNAGKVWVTSARILDEFGQLVGTTDSTDEATQAVNEAQLLSNLIREAVQHFVAKGVQIFVLPYHFFSRVWNSEQKRMVPRTSWVARTIDQLSHEHDIVFVVISGNIHPRDVEEAMRSKSYPSYLLGDLYKVADPGHAALAMTVGSVAHSTRVAASSDELPIAQDGEPSPFTRTGPGISGSIKPEIVERGGNFVQNNSNGLISQNLGTNVAMASNKISPAIRWDCGTSFAAPRVAHHLAMIKSELDSVNITRPSSCLLKAFLLNSCVRKFQGAFSGESVNDSRSHFERKDSYFVLGHGLPHHLGAFDADDYSAIMYYDGQINPDQVAFFSIPVPSVLAANRNEKRLTISVCALPPVQRYGLEDYLGVRIKFRLFRGDATQEAVEEAMSAPIDDDSSSDDTPTPEMPNELPGHLRLNLRSKSCHQQDVFTWNVHSQEMSSNPYTLAIATKKARWGRSNSPIQFAVVVRIEELSRSIAEVFSEVSRTLASARVQTRA